MQEYTFIAGENAPRLDKYLPVLLPEKSRSYFKTLLDAGKVFLDGKPAKAKDKPSPGAKIYFTIDEPEEIDALPEDIPLNIVYEDEDIVVINKPKDMVTHPAPGNYTGTLVNALLFHVQDLSGINGKLRPGIVHRLDKDTTGLLVVAKNYMAHADLQQQIQYKTAGRIYTALVYGNIKTDTDRISAPIGRHSKERKKMAVVHGGRKATSDYTVLARYGDYTLVEVALRTGRTHQIRVHMAHIGNPVVGDELYTKRKNPFGVQGQMLHAGKLRFAHPRTKELLTFEAPLPEDFVRVLAQLESKRR